MAYLHPKYFKPCAEIYKFLNIYPGEKYVVIRFVSWDATHDVGEIGLTNKNKKKLINELIKHAKVIISSESSLPSDLKKYQIQIPAEKMHDVLNYADLYIGEGGTTASECACLGTPNILINSLLKSKTIPGVQLELEKYSPG